MQIKAFVLTGDHRKWPERKNNKGELEPAGEMHTLSLIDMSEPAEARMIESFTYRMSDDEVKKFWVDGNKTKLDSQTVSINCRKLTVNKQGRVNVVGEVIADTGKR